MKGRSGAVTGGGGAGAVGAHGNAPICFRVPTPQRVAVHIDLSGILADQPIHIHAMQAGSGVKAAGVVTLG